MRNPMVPLYLDARTIYQGSGCDGKIRRGLAAEAGEEPEEKGQGGAQEKAGDDWEVESGVFATMDEIAWKSAETKWEPAREIKNSAEENEEAAEEEKSAAKLAKGIHKNIIEERSP